jgi:hypothetical protein
MKYNLTEYDKENIICVLIIVFAALLLIYFGQYDYAEQPVYDCLDTTDYPVEIVEECQIVLGE